MSKCETCGQEIPCYGCFTDEANAEVAAFVVETKDCLHRGDIKTWAKLVEVVREKLTEVGEGATDTVVKENVFHALMSNVKEAGISDVVWMDIYG